MIPPPAQTFVSLLGQRTLRIGDVTLHSECVTLNQPVLVPAAFPV
jgi:hypothetical protein